MEKNKQTVTIPMSDYEEYQTLLKEVSELRLQKSGNIEVSSHLNLLIRELEQSAKLNIFMDTNRNPVDCKIDVTGRKISFKY